MADEKIRYVLDVDDKGTPKLVKFGATAEKSGKQTKKSFEGAGKAVTDFADQIPGASNAMSMFSKGPAAAAGMAIAAVGVGFAAAMKKSIDFADSINDMSLRLGVSTEQLSVLSLYAEQSGTDIETLATAMGKLGVKISEGDKNLKKYGVTAGTADEALFQLADKIAATEDPMMRLKIATDAFGKSGQQMLPLLVQGGDALRVMGKEAPIVSAEMAKMADEFNDKMAELEGKLQSIGLRMAETMLPTLSKMVDLAEQFAIAIGGGADAAGQGANNWAAEAEALKQKLDDPHLSMWARTKIKGQLKEAEFLAKNFALTELEIKVGKESGPGSMGGYRGESLVPTKKAGGFGAGADAPKARAEKGVATEVDWQEWDLENRKQSGDWMSSSVDAPQDPPDYYANIPTSPKAMANLEEQRKKADAIADASIQWQQDQIVGLANSASSVLADGFMKIGGGVDDMLESMADGFAQMLTRMVAELAANAIILGFLSAVAPGAAGGFSKGLGGLSGLVLGGKASGGIPEVGTPTMINERRQEVFIPRDSGRVQATAGGGDVYNFTYSNPAEARSLVRGIREDKRRRNSGVA